MPKLMEKIKSLPQSPGVYIFYGKRREILYVGKATSLRDRVGSYFQNKGGEVRPIEMYISEVEDLRVIKTDTVLEAYIKEQDLIKRWQPKYNAMGKDDRSFVYVAFTKEKFPRALVLRETELEENQNSKIKMQNYNSKFKINNKLDRYGKIYGPYTSRRQIETALKILRKIFPYHNKPEPTEKGCFDYHLGLCPGPYDNAITRQDYLKNIRGIKMILEGKKPSLIRKLEKEMQECSSKQDYEGAARKRNQLFSLKHIQDISLISKQDGKFLTNSKIETRNSKIRIEGYDISNISGKHAVGSMVVFDNSEGGLQANKSEYRKFRIKTIAEANDVGSMEEVLHRRFRNSWKLPNLILLDGGRGHLNMARRVLKIYRHDIPLLAVAKGPTRKKLDLYSWGTVPRLSKNILEQIRNEAHRFAITYHRKLRGRNLLA